MPYAKILFIIFLILTANFSITNYPFPSRIEAQKTSTGNVSIKKYYPPWEVQKVSKISHNIPPIKTLIYRDWWNDPRVQYAYDISKGNMDFILTIEAESRWDMNAVWDKWKSFWLCQIHKKYNAVLQKEYRTLKTDNEKITFCYNLYQWWVKQWVIKTQLYWYNYRKARSYIFTFKKSL
jgi:hypothetical protein